MMKILRNLLKILKLLTLELQNKYETDVQHYEIYSQNYKALDKIQEYRNHQTNKQIMVKSFVNLGGNFNV